MNNRRTATLTLTGLPLLAKAAATHSVEHTESKKEAPENFLSEETARIVSYTIYAEARGEDYEGKRAVASVIATRARLLRRTMAEICLHEKQFSCWNNIRRVPEAYALGTYTNLRDMVARADSYSLAWQLLSYNRKWDRFTHFYNPSKANPSWASKLTGIKTIGNHVFGFMEPRYMPR
ncbi:cell wall hydrolase [Pontiella agarivorans]|uniref:Cell wall hydrolase n=1 Tax=Pontiella agarivorans TaxID=3038953 RepID=A0ABU5MYU0_9BACT|nr:cell wall hydrolase [Pontiella agarivorans]MDZ8119355.1 cell wall hydrolase [Pontiella agarivorans]